MNPSSLKHRIWTFLLENVKLFSITVGALFTIVFILGIYIVSEWHDNKERPEQWFRHKPSQTGVRKDNESASPQEGECLLSQSEDMSPKKTEPDEEEEDGVSGIVNWPSKDEWNLKFISWNIHTPSSAGFCRVVKIYFDTEEIRFETRSDREVLCRYTMAKQKAHEWIEKLRHFPFENWRARYSSDAMCSLNIPIHTINFVFSNQVHCEVRCEGDHGPKDFHEAMPTMPLSLAEYYMFGGKKEELQESLRTWIKQDVDLNNQRDDDRIEDFIEDILLQSELGMEQDDGRGYDMDNSLSCSVIYKNENLISYRIERKMQAPKKQFTSVVVGSFLRTGCRIVVGQIEPMRLGDIVTWEDYPELTRKVREGLVRQLGMESFDEFKRKYQVDIEPGENFYFDDAGLHFVYNKDDIPGISSDYMDVCIDWPCPTSLATDQFYRDRDTAIITEQDLCPVP